MITRTVRALHAALLAAAVPLIFSSAANADAISPQIHAVDPDHPYSEEKPNTAFYGTGVAGRMSEASALRFQGERDTDDGKFDTAIHELAKAVQLDPGDPTGHILYARAMSRKIKAHKNVTPDLVATAIGEWKLLWHHDADYSEQFEAHLETRKLTKIAKVMQKDAKRRHKRGEQPQEFVAEKPKQDTEQ